MTGSISLCQDMSASDTDSRNFFDPVVLQTSNMGQGAVDDLMGHMINV